ncbi:calcium-binding protein [Devosia sp. 2618]|uniref:calcium-binding protein n=1 Tax=Devosia sp. 2618 TaxID=3156454 RepID=UPI003391E0CE
MAKMTFTSDQGYWPQSLQDVLDNGAITTPFGAAANTAVIAWNGYSLILTGTGLVAASGRQLTAGTITGFELTGPDGSIFKLNAFTAPPSATSFQQILTLLDGPFTKEQFINLLNSTVLKESLTVVGHAGFDTIIGTPYADSFDGKGDSNYLDYSLETGSGGAILNFKTGKFTDTHGNIDTVKNIIEAGGSNNNDTFISSGTADYHYWSGNGGADTYRGSDNTWETISYRFENGSEGVVANLKTGQGTDTFGNIETYEKIDELEGSKLADRLTGSDGDNWFAGNDGADTIDGGKGRDGVYYHREAGVGGTGGVIVNLSSSAITADVGKGSMTVKAGTAIDSFGKIDTLKSIEDVRGTRSDDVLRGSDADNRLRGDDGNDDISGGGGNDNLDGGNGNDTLRGDDGDDYFNSGIGTDKLYGGNGDDYFDLGKGNDFIDGGAGWDKISYAEEDGGKGIRVDTATGKIIDTFGNTDTIINIEGIKGSRYADVFNGSAGNDYFEGLAGADTFDGKKGSDQVDYQFEQDYGGKQGVIVNLSAALISADIGKGLKTVKSLTAIDGFGTVDKFVSIEDISGTNFNDVIYGNSGSNNLEGFGGNDIIYAGAGDDNLRGSDGNDKLYGEAGNDRFKGGIGNDTIDGGAGRDRIEYFLETPASTDTSGKHGVIVNLSTSAISANVGQGTKSVAAGKAIDATGGTDTIKNVEDLRTTEFADYLVGNASDNYFEAGAGNDVLIGGAGNDTLIGGLGRDIMTGGAGRDTFRFESIKDFGTKTTTRDVIKDFDSSDIIDLRAIDANSKTSGDDAFTFKAAQSTTFSGTPGQLIWSQQNVSGTANDKTIIMGDTNGDKIADFHIELSGLINLNSGDFLL